MTAIITGDVINSRADQNQQWLKLLKARLQKIGKEPKQWEIFRGDSFQVEVLPANALEQAILIKASIKQERDIDVRLGIGIGTKTTNATKITEANGSAFVNSGECFEQLKKQTLAIKTDVATFDEPLNLMLDLAMLTMDNWPPITAGIVMTVLDNPTKNQMEIAKKLKKSQSSISEALNRSGYAEIQDLINYYRKKVDEL